MKRLTDEKCLESRTTTSQLDSQSKRRFCYSSKQHSRKLVFSWLCVVDGEGLKRSWKKITSG